VEEEEEDDWLFWIVGWGGAARVNVYFQGEGSDGFEGVGLPGCHLVFGIGREDEVGFEETREVEVHIYSHSRTWCKGWRGRAPFTVPIRSSRLLMIGSQELIRLFVSARKAMRGVLA
jgi:hypothetical protein